MDLTTKSPAEIDELWAPIQYREQAASIARIEASVALHNAERLIADGLRLTRFELEHAQRQIDDLPARIEKLDQERLAAYAEQDPFRTEWARRNGWTRAYLVVTNGQGHVHRSTSCSTCYATTQFSWITEFSGATEQEIVDAAGERACTVCYASAPVELRLDRPTKMFSEDEKRKQAEREEREAKRAAAKAQEIVVENYFDMGRRSSHTFKTVRGATNAIASELSSLCWYGPTHSWAEGWKSNVESIRRALADRGIDYDYDKALANARKKANRESTQGAQF